MCIITSPHPIYYFHDLISSGAGSETVSEAWKFTEMAAKVEALW